MSESAIVLPHDATFPDRVRAVLDGRAEFKPWRGFVIPVGHPYYLTFLTFLAEEFEGLPFVGHLGRVIPMRRDAQVVVRQIATWLRTWERTVTRGGAWTPATIDPIRNIFTDWLEVYKSEIYAEHATSGVCHSIDLGARHQEDGTWSPLDIILERFWVAPGGAKGVVVQYNGKCILRLESGELVVDHDTSLVSHVHVG